MKKVFLPLWELTKEEASKLLRGTALMIYQPETKLCNIKYVDDNYSRERILDNPCGNVFYVFGEPKLKKAWFVTGMTLLEDEDGEAPVKIGPFYSEAEANCEAFDMRNELTLASQHLYFNLRVIFEEVLIV